MKQCKHWLFRNSNYDYTGVTTVSALVAMEMAIKYKQRTLFITQDDPFRGVSHMFAKQFQQLKKAAGAGQASVPQGWHTLLHYSRTNFLNEELLVASTHSLFPGLDIMKVTDEDFSLSVDSIEADINHVVDIMERCYDVVIWDYRSSSSISKRGVDEQARVPIWLSSRECAVTDFLLQDHQLQKSVQQLFGGYRGGQNSHLYMGLINMHDQRLLYNLSDVKRKFRYVPLFAIPYDHQLRSSIQEGSLLPFYLRLLHRHHHLDRASLLSALSLISRYFVRESALMTSSWDGEQRWG